MLIDTLSRRLVQRMLDKEIIKFDDWEIYMFGIQLIVSAVFKLIGFMTFAWVLGWTVEALIFLTIFGMIRVNTGGYHAKSYLMCFIVTGTMMTAAILLSKIYLVHSTVALPVILTVAVALILIYAPVDSANRRLNTKEREVNRIRSLLMAFFLSAIILLAYWLYPQGLIFCNVAAMAMLFESMTLAPIFAD
jgi:accessory gene regulator B